jgi:hypothetical protein
LLEGARMIRTLSLLGLVFVLGCGSSSNNGNGGNGGGSGGGGGDAGIDMSAAAGSDLAMTLPADMQPAYGCHALLACLNACGTDQTACNLCLQSATMQGLGLYGTMRNCVRRTCNPHPDGGPAPCTNGAGTPSPECTMCRADAIKMTGSCGSDTMYCGACYSQYSACEANLP